MCHERNWKSSPTFGLSAVDILPFIKFRAVKHVAQLHQFSDKSGISVMQTHSYHACCVRLEQTDFFLCGILMCLGSLCWFGIFCRCRLATDPDFQLHWNHFGVTFCLRRCDLTQCPRKSLQIGFFAVGSHFLYQLFLPYLHDVHNVPFRRFGWNCEARH